MYLYAARSVDWSLCSQNTGLIDRSVPSIHMTAVGCRRRRPSHTAVLSDDHGQSNLITVLALKALRCCGGRYSGYHCCRFRHQLLPMITPMQPTETVNYLTQTALPLNSPGNNSISSGTEPRLYLIRNVCMAKPSMSSNGARQSHSGY